uniref:SS18 N-terminal domain-containing protein n=1 Tax=Triticum urartu TaxID=4572 RepID=A0A8R7U8L0_TRIUA
MQQAMSLPPGAVGAVSSPAGITTEQIQKYLDENKQLILAILENQNLGKLAECAQYQAQLQKNLLYLAAIADAQPPQNPTSHPQVSLCTQLSILRKDGLWCSVIYFANRWCSLVVCKVQGITCHKYQCSLQERL